MNSDKPTQDFYQGSGSKETRIGDNSQRIDVHGGQVHIGNTYTSNTSNGPVKQSFQNADSSIPAESPTAKFTKLLRFPGMNHRYNNIKPQQDRSCAWLLETTQWLEWQDSSKIPEHQGFFWIKGKAGSGKSTMMKFATRAVQDQRPDQNVLFYFFNARGAELEKSVLGLYRSLPHQALKKLSARKESVDALLSSHLELHDSDELNLITLQDVFKFVVNDLRDTSLTCFIDALDECNEDDIRDMLSFFESLVRSAAKSNHQFRVCFSSRHYPHITLRNGLELVLENEDKHQEDIVRHVDNELRIDSSKRVKNIKAKLVRCASGIFLWVYLVTRILNKEHGRGRDDEELDDKLEKCIDEIPELLEDLFESILNAATDQAADLVLILQFILSAWRPITCPELYFAIRSIQNERSGVYWDRTKLSLRTMKRFVLDSSRGLIEVVGSDCRVQLIHESVRSYFSKPEGITKLQPRLLVNPVGLSHDDLKRCCQKHISLFIEANPGWDDDQRVPLGLVSPEEFAGSSDEYEEYYLPLQWDKVEYGSSADDWSFQHPFMRYAVRGLLFHADVAHEHGVPQRAFLDEFVVDMWKGLYEVFVDPWKFFEANCPVQNDAIFSILNFQSLGDAEADRMYANMPVVRSSDNRVPSPNPRFPRGNRNRTSSPSSDA